jgi:hypothetical protein
MQEVNGTQGDGVGVTAINAIITWSFTFISRTILSLSAY